MKTRKLLLLAQMIGYGMFVTNGSCTKPPPERTINQSPIANAGPDQTIILPRDNTRLDGGASHDPDGTIVSYTWATVGGPNSPNMDKDRVLVAGLQPHEMFVSDLAEGEYQFELVVTDNRGARGKDTVKVTVIADPLTSDPSRMKRFDSLSWGDGCAIRISNISSVIPAPAGIEVFMSSYYGGGPMSSFVPSSGWYPVLPARSTGFWYEVINDVLIIHAAANVNCDWDDAIYDVLVKWN